MAPKPTRRRALRTAGTTLAVALAGCLRTGVRRTATLQPPDGEDGDAFGWDVALSSDWALVGAPAAGEGAAYVFDGERLTRRLEPERTAGEFGGAVALDGDRALVGASATADPDIDGAVTVYRNTDREWIREARLVAPDPRAGGEFGYDVALDGGRALVGARGTDHGGSADAGVAHVYDHTGGGWTHRMTLAPSDATAYDYAAGSVALGDGRALLGSFLADATATDSGAGTVFARDGGVWTERTTLTAPDGQSGDRFGNAVALDDGTALVGAVGRGGGAEAAADSGGAYVFGRDDGGWTHRTTLPPPEDTEDGAFGVAVALGDEWALVGAFTAGPGQATLFERNGTGLDQRTTLRPEDGDAGDAFGGAVALAGDRALVGSVGDGPGSATLFEL